MTISKTQRDKSAIDVALTSILDRQRVDDLAALKANIDAERAEYARQFANLLEQNGFVEAAAFLRVVK